MRRWAAWCTAVIGVLASAGVSAAGPGRTPQTGPAATARASDAAGIDLSPPAARPGDAFLVKVRGPGAAPAHVEGSAAGRSLAFFRAPGGVAAFGALPLETPPGPLPVDVRLRSVPLVATLEVAAPAFPRRELQVAERFVAPPAPEVQARIDADRAAFADAFAQPPRPPFFTGRFVPPRKARVTAGYGEERTFNRTRPSQHYGQDLAGAVGAPVVAANAGRVVLVRDCFASGRSVIVFHGAGVYTTYFHLSKFLVKPGQVVQRGQRIGLVGRTGRASGPHLHWGVRVGDLYVDPASVLRLSVSVAR